ncbi:MAG: hypothetical protein Q9221_008501 [Calogaya cf. arnoldii]
MATLSLARPNTQTERCLTIAAPRKASLALRHEPVALSIRQAGALALLFLLHFKKVVFWTKCIVVSAAAYTTLSALYSYILETLLDEWANSPPQNQLVIEAGQLRWEFGCTANPVPIEFVEEYIRSKQAAVERGFAEVYAREWWFAKGDDSRRCYAGMRVAREGEEIVPPELPGR